MSNLIQIKVAELNQLNPLMIAEDNRVEQKFIQMYNAIWGTAQGAQIYEKEKFNFRKILQDKPELQKCTPLSLYGCFLDIAVNGLSLDPTGRPHCYILPRSTKTGYKDNNLRTTCLSLHHRIWRVSHAATCRTSPLRG